MMLPILISVSVAPTSYFFCAKEGLLVTSSSARAAEKAPSRKLMTGILISLGSRLIVLFLVDWTHLSAPAGIEYLSLSASNKKPPRRGRGGLAFSRTVRADARPAEY